MKTFSPRPPRSVRGHVLTPAPLSMSAKLWSKLRWRFVCCLPLAYAVLMPACYIPIILLLLGLVFRGVAFEFRFKAAGAMRKFWDWAFSIGFLVAAFCQGMVLGTIIQGIKVRGRSFVGRGFDRLSVFSIMTGLAVVMPDLIWISELGGPDPRICHPDLLRLGPRKLNLMCRYGPDRLNFQWLDKFLVREAVSKTLLEGAFGTNLAKLNGRF